MRFCGVGWVFLVGFWFRSIYLFFGRGEGVVCEYLPCTDKPLVQHLCAPPNMIYNYWNRKDFQALKQAAQASG